MMLSKEFQVVAEDGSVTPSIATRALEMVLVIDELIGRRSK